MTHEVVGSISLTVRAGMAAGFVGVVLLAGCSEPTPQWSPPESAAPSASPSPTPTPSPTPKPKPTTTAEACLNLIDEGAYIDPSECQPVPRIKDGTFRAISSPLRSIRACVQYGRLVAYFAGSRQPKTDVSGLPHSATQAVETALANPVTKTLTGYAEGGVAVVVDPEASEVDAYSNEVSEREASERVQDVIELCPGAKGELLGADIRIALDHEGGHAVYSQLEEIAAGTGEQAAAVRHELQQLQELCTNEYGHAIEGFRIKYQSRAQKALADLFGAFEQRNDRAYMAAITELQARFETPNGLKNILITETDQGVTWGDLYSLIDAVKTRQGNSSKTTLKNQNIEVEKRIEWSTLAYEMDKYQRAYFSYMLEGEIFEGVMMSRAGHADTATGNMASVIASTQSHPKEVIIHTMALPAQERQLVMAKFGSIYRLVELINPDLASKLNLGSVVKALKAEQERRIAAEVRKLVAETDGEWRQLARS